MKLSKKRLLGVKITSTPHMELIEFVATRLKKKQKTVIFTPNPEILVKAYQSTSFSSVLNSSDINIPDGAGIQLFLGTPVIKGRQFMMDILSLMNVQRQHAFLVGGDSKTMAKCAKKLTLKYPALTVTSVAGPHLNSKGNPDTEIDRLIQKDITDRIGKERPDFLFVGFGAPKQEYWISNNIDTLPLSGAMAVGGSFDYLAGTAAMPPQIINILHLEWFWRLITQPKRLIRVFKAVIVFPILVVKEKILRNPLS